MPDNNEEKFVYTYEHLYYDLKRYLNAHKDFGRADRRDDGGIRSMAPCSPPRYNPYRIKVIEEILEELAIYKDCVGKEFPNSFDHSNEEEPTE